MAVPDAGRSGREPAAPELDLLGGLVERVDSAEIAKRMVSIFRSRIAGYQRLPEQVVIGQILEVARRNVELFFRLILEGRPPSEPELEPFRISAKDRASEGMPLEDLLHAYRLGGRIAWRALSAEATSEEEPALLLGAELLMDYIDRVSAVVAQAYLDERQHLVSEEERRLRDLLDALTGVAPLAPELHALADRMGFPIEDRYRPFARALPGAPPLAHAQRAAAMREEGVLALTEGDRIAGLVPAGRPLGDLEADGALVAIGEPAPREELPGALREVRLVLDLAARLGQTSGRVTTESFLPELLVAGSPRLARMIRARSIGPLETYAERRGSDLLDTLGEFLDCQLDRRRCAERLSIHPNTLDYRLKRIEELTGVDLRRPTDLALVSLALVARRLDEPA